MKQSRRTGLGLSLLGLSLFGLNACGAPSRWPVEALGTQHQALSASNVRWQQRHVTLPPSRMAHAMLYDSLRQVTLVAGGRPVNDNGSSLSDTWSWDGQSWTQLSASFSPRGFLEGTFDSQRGVALTYGGIDQNPSSSYFGETWERTTGNWSNRSGTPGARSTTSISFDSGRDVSVLFGGFNGAWLNDLWEWNGTSWNQRCNSGPCSSAPHPSNRAAAALAYDAARQQTLLFGGFQSTGSDTYLGDTWLWDGNSWTDYGSGPAPSARTSAAMSYDPVTRCIYLFGGRSSTAELHDLWAWDGSSWDLIDDSPPPSTRRDARLVWDSTRRRGILFGGRSNSQAVDFWELSLVGNACSSEDQCHTGYCDGSTCTDPPNPGDAGTAGGQADAAPSAPEAGPDTTGGAAGAGGAGDASGSAGSASAGASSTSPDQHVTDAGIPTADEEPPLRGLGHDKSKSLYACSTATTPAPPSAAAWLGAAWIGLGLGRRTWRRARSSQ